MSDTSPALEIAQLRSRLANLRRGLPCGPGSDEPECLARMRALARHLTPRARGLLLYAYIEPEDAELRTILIATAGRRPRA